MRSSAVVQRVRLGPSIALAAALGCRGPAIAGYEDDESFTTLPGESESESETGDGDPFACEPWDQPAQPTGMGDPITLSFVDASAELGLIETAYFPGEWPPGCDPNGEGWVTTPCKMYLQGGGAAVGDFDEDGWPDIYLTRVGAPGRLFRNLEGGAFEEVGAQLGLLDDFDGNGAAWADVDGDDDLDLYVTSFGDPARYWFYRNTLRESGEPGFVEEAHARGLALDDGEPHFGFSIAVGDYDRDGWLDLYTTEWRPGSSPTEATAHARLLRNLGDGTYEDRTLAAAASMLMKNPAGMHAFAPAFVDLDEDGWPDLTVVSDNGTSRLFWNAGDGSFIDGTPRAGVSLEQNGMGSTFGDYDGDGHLDWYVTAIFSPEDSLECGNLVCGKGGNRLYRSKGPRCFEELGREHDVHDGGWGWGATFFDPDNDGDLDIVETNGFYVPHGPPGVFFVDEPLRFWRNGSELLEQAGFSEAAVEVGLDDRGQGRGLVAFDYDRDGDEDLLIVDSGGPYGTGTKLWRNQSGSQNAWLAVELDGHAGNARGLGARIELRREVAGPTQVRVIGVGSHFLGFGEQRAHFGLGPHEGVVAELRVIWPSGAQTVLTGVPARQVVTVVEP
jgi:hypothetical protein